MTPDLSEPVEGPTWLSVQEIAEKLRISKMSVHRIINTGALPAHRFGRTIRVEAHDFRAYLSATRLTVEA